MQALQRYRKGDLVIDRHYVYVTPAGWICSCRAHESHLTGATARVAAERHIAECKNLKDSQVINYCLMAVKYGQACNHGN